MTIYIHFTDAPSQKLYNVNSVTDTGFQSVCVANIFGGQATIYHHVRTISIEPDNNTQIDLHGEPS